MAQTLQIGVGTKITSGALPLVIWNTAGSGFLIDASLAAVSPTYLVSIVVAKSRGVGINMEATDTFTSAGSRSFTDAFETAGRLTFRAGTQTLTLTGIGDSDEPYNWIAPNAAEVAAFIRGYDGEATNLELDIPPLDIVTSAAGGLVGTVAGTVDLGPVPLDIRRQRERAIRGRLRGTIAGRVELDPPPLGIQASFTGGLAGTVAGDVRTATVAAAPTVPTLSATVTGGVIAEWTAPADGGNPIVGHKLRYRPFGTAAWTEVAGITATSYTVTGLDAGTGYSFQVSAVNGIGASPYSPIATIRTRARIVADVRSHGELIISQYRNSTRLRALINGGLAITQSKLIEPLFEIETHLSLDTAGGVWLDYIGLRLGLSRPNRLPAGVRFFGFGKSEDRTSFDLAPFSGLGTLEILVPVGDNWYRSMLKGRALALRSGTSIPEIEAIAAATFTGGGWVEEMGARSERFGFAPGADFDPAVHRRNTGWDNAPFRGVFVEDIQAVMVHVTEDRRGFVSLVRESGLIPRPAGVELTIQEEFS